MGATVVEASSDSLSHPGMGGQTNAQANQPQNSDQGGTKEDNKEGIRYLLTSLQACSLTSIQVLFN